MITFSSNLRRVLSNPVVESFYMVRVGTFFCTNHFSDVTLSNGNVYLADGRLAAVDAPKLTASVDREIFKVSLADPLYELSSMAGTGLVGKLFEVRMGFIDPDNNNVLTDVGDTILTYKGIVDSTSYSIQTGNSGETMLNLSGASPMADLDSTRNFSTSKDFIRGLYQNDSAFDQIYEGSGQVALKWGKG